MTSLFSVVIPTTGRSQLIEKALRAIAAQNRPPREVIVVIRSDDTVTRHRLTAMAEELDQEEAFGGGQFSLRIETVDEPGLVAALNVGLYAVTSEFVAFTDDDAVPGPAWLSSFEAVYRRDPSVGGVGGRDVIFENGAWIDARPCSVGRLSWFGRLGSNHHLGVGEAREVDFLKGVNMSYRADAAKMVGFDERLRGSGCQVANEVSLGLPLRRWGWRLLYDPQITVEHFPATRPPGDDRLSRDLGYLRDAAFNESLLICEQLGWARRLVFLVYAIVVGNRRHYGLGQALRFLPRRGRIVFSEWIATAHGRLNGLRSRRRRDVAVHAPPTDGGAAVDDGLRATVVVPTFRRVASLRRCLDALDRQTRSPDETIIIVRREDESTRRSLEDDPPPDHLRPRVLLVDEPGVIHAINMAIAAATGDIIAFTDDDARPWATWLERLARHFADPTVGGVGGRDWVFEDGQRQIGAEPRVGTLRWFGQLVGNHHLGVGPPRDVDALKGVNMAFRLDLAKRVGVDPRLLGEGAQVANEVTLSLPLRRQGWRIVYDPSIAVDHHPSVRHDIDQRQGHNPTATYNASHNVTLPILEHLPSWRLAAFALWATLLGTRRHWGVAQFFRFVLWHPGGSLPHLVSSLRGRRAAVATWRREPAGPASVVTSTDATRMAKA
ncbi:MAG: glycosyltransferase [Planctomycetota bacterium]